MMTITFMANTYKMFQQTPAAMKKEKAKGPKELKEWSLPLKSPWQPSLPLLALQINFSKLL